MRARKGNTLLVRVPLLWLFNQVTFRLTKVCLNVVNYNQ
jgi:hypothetical protein